MHDRPIRTSLGSESYVSAFVCTRPKIAIGNLEKQQTKILTLSRISTRQTNVALRKVEPISTIFRRNRFK